MGHWSYASKYFNFGTRGSADVREGKPVKITGPGCPEGVRGSCILHIFLSFTVLSLFIDCTYYPFQTKPKSLGN